MLTPDVNIIICGTLRVDEDIDLRLVKGPYGWVADSVHNRTTGITADVPACFELREEHVQTLDHALCGALRLN